MKEVDTRSWGDGLKDKVHALYVRGSGLLLNTAGSPEQ